MITNQEEYIRKAKIIRVIDGDTYDVEIDLGFKTWIHKRVRLIGVDTAEITGNKEEKEIGLKAKDIVSNWFNKRDNKILIKTYKEDSFGRTLVDIADFTLSDLATFLIENNYAKKYLR